MVLTATADDASEQTGSMPAPTLDRSPTSTVTSFSHFADIENQT